MTQALENYRDILKLESPVDGETETRLVQAADEIFFLFQRIKVAAQELDGIKKYVYYKKGPTKDREINDRLKVGEKARILHAIIGLVGEAGELAEAGQKIMKGDGDEVNLIEEFGDVRWYTELALDELKSTMAEVEDKNARKLITRYGDVFSTEAALNRDLKAEREQLES